MTEVWPQPPEVSQSDSREPRLMLYKAQLDAHAADRERLARQNEDERVRLAEADEARRAAAYEAHYSVLKALVDARLAAISASTDRAAKAAEFCRNAAAAVVTLYTGLLGLAFSAKDGTPVTATGAAPSIFLAASLALATAYAAFVTKGRGTPLPEPHSALALDEERRLDAYAEWVNELVSRRSWALRSAVLCLGAGALLLPVPFLGWQPSWVWATSLVLAGAIVGYAAVAGMKGQR